MIKKDKNSQFILTIEEKVKQPYKCIKCGDEFYFKYKDFENTCFCCAMEIEKTIK